MEYKVMRTSTSNRTITEFKESKLLNWQGQMPVIMPKKQNDFNETTTDYPRNKTISQLFEESVNRYNNQTAVQLNDRCLTYTELNEKANVLAHYLQAQGVGPNVLVALYFERSIELIISMLAILKAGGAYVPLDIEEPTNRTNTILQDCNPIKILTTSDIIGSLENKIFESQNKLIKVDEFLKENKGDSENPICTSSPTDLIYVMYTSGTTGTPKGCMIPQRGVVRLVKNTNYVEIHPSDKIAQIASVAFDAITFEVWGALLNGAELHIVPRSTILSIDDFSELLKHKEISILLITTSLFNLIIKDRSDVFDNLKYVLIAGEKVNPEVVNLLVKRKEKLCLSHLNILNGYGPTENTTFSTVFNITKTEFPENNVPIGMPISNTKCYVLDEGLDFVPAGIPGELYVAGDGLALGYLNDKAQTEAKFIDSPWNQGEKIYRTGDLVYWTSESGIVFLDRVDRQVKIRGFRIELSEIEACLYKYPAVNQAVLITEEKTDGQKKLVAYIKFNPNSKVNSLAFRRFLKENLPHYMIPNEIVKVDYIPLTISGKIDKNRLQNLSGKILEGYASLQVVPTNEIEKMVLDALKEILNVSILNTNQNFFDLGAHSLTLCQMCSVLNTKLASKKMRAVNIMNILTYPTVQRLAKYIKEGSTALLKTSTKPVFANKTHHQKFTLAYKNQACKTAQLI